MSSISEGGYRAARNTSAFINRVDRGRIVVSGADRRSYLQGLLTNDIAALAPGTGCYAAYLTPQGRMIADLYVYELGDVILLTVPVQVKDTVLAKLDQFIFSEDVQLGDVTEAFAQTTVLGPQAAQTIAAQFEDAGAERLTPLPEHGNVRASFRGGAAIVVRTFERGVPGFDLFVERERAGDLADALRNAGVAELDDTTGEALRIEGGVPMFGRDMDETIIPLEAVIEPRAVSFTKGCYVGQEVIIRVMHRGHGRVAKKLVGLAVAGDAVPAAGAAVREGDREIGHVTSSAWSPALGQPIALGYVQRDFVEPGTRVKVGDSDAEVRALPFVP
jgi:folate-binding protein YgfZ